jgi:hypothetical protein
LCRPLPLYPNPLKSQDPLKSAAVEQLDQLLYQLLSVRKSLSASQASFGLQSRELSHAAAALEPVITALQAQKDQVDEQIAQLTARRESWRGGRGRCTSMARLMTQNAFISKICPRTLDVNHRIYSFGFALVPRFSLRFRRRVRYCVGRQGVCAM